MRILHILDHSLPWHSGYTFRTLAILAEQRALGWQTWQLTTPRHGASPSERETLDGWTFLRTAPEMRWLHAVPIVGLYLAEIIATIRRLDTLVQRLQPDVLHAHSPVLTALPALWVGRRRGVPMVYEMRALWEDGAVDHGTTTARSLRYRLTRTLETFVLRHADHITTICEGLRNDIAMRGIPDRRITVIPNAVDTARFTLDPTIDPELARQYKPAGSVMLGFAGSWYGYEGLTLLVNAIARLRNDHPELRLLLVGGGPQRETLQSLILQHALTDRVTLAGRVPHDEVHRYYALMDVMVYPRLRMRLTDTVTPLKPLEAMAQGRIVIASDVGGHRELIRDGETGHLFAADDTDALARKIAQVLRERGEWPAMHQRARRFVERERTWRASTARYQSVYDEVRKIGKPTPPLIESKPDPS